jgi:hypothetical protein
MILVRAIVFKSVLFFYFLFEEVFSIFKAIFYFEMVVNKAFSFWVFLGVGAPYRRETKR